MRDPARIERIINLLRKCWYIVPDWRFGQFVTNLLGEQNFYIEDDITEELLTKFYEMYGTQQKNGN